VKKFKLGLLGVFASILLAPSIVNAAEITVCSTSCDHNSLESAITAATPGDTILLNVAGEYQLPVTTIDKTLTIKGVNEDAIIVPFGTITDTWITVSSTGNLTLDTVTLNGKGYETTPFTISKAITTFGTLSIYDVTIENIKYATGNGIGIYSSGEVAAGSLTIDGLTMNNVEYAGIYLDKAVNNVTTTIENYTYTGRGTIMTNRQFGIIVAGGRIARATDINISACFGEDSIANSSAAIYVFGNEGETISAISVLYSDLRNNTASFYLGNESGADGIAVAGESLLTKSYLRNTSDFHGTGLFFGEFTTAEEILDEMFKVGIDEAPTFQVDYFYTDENAVGTGIFDVRLKKDEYELGINESETIEVIWTVADSETVDKTLTWASDDESIVTVDENGKITGVAAGSTIVRATTSYGKVLSAAVTVVANPQTADLPIIVISALGILGLGYIVYAVNKKQVRA